jgi:hypothetical protein
MKKIFSEKFTFNGWDIKQFLKGRKRLLVTLIGAIAGYVATQDPLLSGITGASAEMLYSIIDYYLKD